jgi:hypothetical protein
MFAENKYTRWYFKIVDSARHHTRDGYVEEHHIIPLSLGGSDAPDNLVKLTGREHFICHLLLLRMVTDAVALVKMRKAIRFMMCVPKKMQGLRWMPTGRTVEIARKEAALANKGNREIAAKISASRKGQKLSDEHKRKISEGSRGKGRGRALASIEAQRGKPKSEAAKEKMRLAWIARRERIAAGLETRKPMSEEGRRNLSMAKKGKTLSEAVRRSISEKHKLLWQQPEHRQRMLAARSRTSSVEGKA